jgi:hypothetical protein
LRQYRHCPKSDGGKKIEFIALLYDWTTFKNNPTSKTHLQGSPQAEKKHLLVATGQQAEQLLSQTLILHANAHNL